MITFQPSLTSKQQCSLADDSCRQSFVPFLSKQPRFHSPKIKQVAKPPFGLLYNSSIHQSTITSKPNNKPTHNFRSQIPRFPQPSITQTPSPTHYLIQQCSKSREKSPLNRLQNIKLPHIQTIPTIPDSRNKFGYLYINKYFALAEKTEEQVNLQKKLMKEYQATLTEQQRCRKSSEKDKNHDAKNLQKKISQIFSKQRKQKQNVQNGQSFGKSHSALSLKPKYLHLYNYKEPQVIKPPQKVEKQPIKHSSRTRFQFFNSSEQRFKLKTSKDEAASKHPGVRDYLLKLQRH